jgi:hypothetical protein
MVLLASNLLVTASMAGGAGNTEGTVLRQVANIAILITSIVAARSGKAMVPSR